jgi:hypothetical protein
VLSGEGWPNIMYDTARAGGDTISFIYFFSMVVVGNFIMLNLFLAILLGNFDESRTLITEERNKLKREERRQKQGSYSGNNNDKIEEY